MSGVALTDHAPRTGGSLADGDAPRRAFGQRLPGAGAGTAPRAMNRDVPDLRRRIDEHAPTLQGRLPWAVGSIVILVLSAGLWLDVFEVATLLARHVARMF